MTAGQQYPVTREHCDHECVCNKYIDYTNTGATSGRVCNGETWCFKPCSHDTRSRPDPLALLEAWDAYNNSHFLQPHPVFRDMIRIVRENPDAVLQKLKELGVWKE